MIPIEELSKVGFGGYRVSLKNKQHKESLDYALKCGCNLIDTASNYTRGESEKLIGEVTKQNSNEVFIISKAGYANKSDLTKYGENKVIEFKQDWYHSLHPDFLKDRLEQSLERLKRDYLDCFLLHNPEFLLNDDGSNAVEFNDQLKVAFQLLDEFAQEGKIRYFGISSNSIQDETSGFTLDSLVDSVGETKYFKFIQFPYNLVERNLSKSSEYENTFLHKLKTSGLISLGNRPFNANSNNGPIRLILEVEDASFWKEAEKLIEGFIIDLSNYLKELNSDDDILDFEVISYLKKNWNMISHPDPANRIFNEHLFPFVEALFDRKIPETVMSKLKILQRTLEMAARKNSSKLFKEILSEHNIYDSQLGNSDYQRKLIGSYLNDGVSHTLVGMRQKKYVDNLKSFFKR